MSMETSDPARDAGAAAGGDDEMRTTAGIAMISTADSRIRLSVVIPVRDEEDNILPLVREIREALDRRVPYEVIYVDDGSRDATYQRLLAARREVLPDLRILRHPSPGGQSTALHNGIAASRARWVATLDGDGQNDPADILKLLAIRDDDRGADPPSLICGLRRARQDAWLRRVSSRFANRVRSRVLGDGIPDTGCGLKLLSRQAFLELPSFDHMHRFLPALVRRGGGRVVTVEVSHRPRVSGSSKYGVLDRLWVGFVDLLGVLWLQHRRCPNVASKAPAVQASRRGPSPTVLRDASRRRAAL